ncbi:hypothetical protein ER308_10720 [Egibacter rhizosphaerae]|uniref:FtsW/RodA/SpoVE family cell cycle protein n=1 Tax=Egibacter rhizosphaerae TaxID=1670831 RepID=A0A411YFE5_9ACTN|nr:FtsW/RodA/SpoVE family cell cycle protein [Egibacter rhizosphaerae]QBI19984.1 hypothetical protein ER308_10720 [Egibacter rhizosphaerae]
MTPAGRRANTELGLLLIALLVTALAAVLVELVVDPDLPPGRFLYLAPLPVLAAGVHLLKRRLAPGSDPVLIPVTLLLNGLGLVMMRRIDLAELAQDADAAQLAPTQGVWTTVAVLAFAGTLVVLRDYGTLDGYRYVIGLGAVVLLLTPLLPGLGQEISGARIWLQIGGMTIQPVEVAKLGFVVFFASYLAEKRDLLSFATSRLGPLMSPPPRAFAPLLILWALGMAVQGLQNDLGPSLLLFGVFIVMIYVATGRAIYPIASLLLAALGGWFAYTQFAHVSSRVAIWFDPRGDEFGAGQLLESLFAFGTGGIFGVGLGQGQPDFIPAVRTDFVFAAIGEEMGLLGATAVLLCFVLLAGRGFRIALGARDEFGTLLALGLTTIFALQVFIIVAGVTRLIPLTGITLPFVSYGGSSLLANWVLIALLVRVSAPITPRRTRERTDDEFPEDAQTAHVPAAASAAEAAPAGTPTREPEAAGAGEQPGGTGVDQPTGAMDPVDLPDPEASGSPADTGSPPGASHAEADDGEEPGSEDDEEDWGPPDRGGGRR